MQTETAHRPQHRHREDTNTRHGQGTQAMPPDKGGTTHDGRPRAGTTTGDSPGPRPDTPPAAGRHPTPARPRRGRRIHGRRANPAEEGDAPHDGHAGAPRTQATATGGPRAGGEPGGEAPVTAEWGAPHPDLARGRPDPVRGWPDLAPGDGRHVAKHKHLCLEAGEKIGGKRRAAPASAQPQAVTASGTRRAHGIIWAAATTNVNMGS